MKKHFIKKIMFFLIFVSFVCYSEQIGKPVLINTEITNFADISSQKISEKFFVGDITDKRKNAGSDTVGFTRTGRFVISPLICKPSPTAVLLNSINGILKELKIFEENKDSAKYQIDAELLEYSVEETNKVFSQQMRAKIKFRVKIKESASGALINQFVIKAEDSRSAVDTTPFADKVLKNAMIYALQNLLESLSTIK
jgi:hypothetical protein